MLKGHSFRDAFCRWCWLQDLYSPPSRRYWSWDTPHLDVSDLGGNRLTDSEAVIPFINEIEDRNTLTKWRT
jgi:hypothetical protein